MSNRWRTTKKMLDGEIRDGRQMLRSIRIQLRHLVTIYISAALLILTASSSQEVEVKKCEAAFEDRRRFEETQSRYHLQGRRFIDQSTTMASVLSSQREDLRQRTAQCEVRITNTTRRNRTALSVLQKKIDSLKTELEEVREKKRKCDDGGHRVQQMAVKDSKTIRLQIGMAEEQVRTY